MSEKTNSDLGNRSPHSLSPSSLLTHRLGEWFYDLAISLSEKRGVNERTLSQDCTCTPAAAPRGRPRSLQALACCFLPLQFHRRFLDGYTRERERVRNMTASTTAPRAIALTAAAPQQVKGVVRRSHKRALRLPPSPSLPASTGLWSFRPPL